MQTDQSRRGKFTIQAHKPLLFGLVAAAVVVGVYAMFLTMAPVNPQLSTKAYQQQLQNQVDTSTGAPVNGRDPATQGQSELNKAASTPTDFGLQGQPASSVSNTTDDMSSMHDH